MQAWRGQQRCTSARNGCRAKPAQPAKRVQELTQNELLPRASPYPGFPPLPSSPCTSPRAHPASPHPSTKPAHFTRLPSLPPGDTCLRETPPPLRAAGVTRTFPFMLTQRPPLLGPRKGLTGNQSLHDRVSLLRRQGTAGL